jgi:hypothetical protein
MTVQLDLEFSQVKTLIDRLPRKEKEVLARYLDDEVLFDEMRKVQEELRDTPLTEEDILREVKAVRKARAARARRR